MKKLFTLISTLLLSSNAIAASSSTTDQYINDKVAHAQFLREQANDRVADLRYGANTNKPVLVSTGASLNGLAPAAGPSPSKSNLQSPTITHPPTNILKPNESLDHPENTTNNSSKNIKIN